MKLPNSLLLKPAKSVLMSIQYVLHMWREPKKLVVTVFERLTTWRWNFWKWYIFIKAFENGLSQLYCTAFVLPKILSNTLWDHKTRLFLSNCYIFINVFRYSWEISRIVLMAFKAFLVQKLLHCKKSLKLPGN